MTASPTLILRRRANRVCAENNAADRQLKKEEKLTSPLFYFKPITRPRIKRRLIYRKRFLRLVIIDAAVEIKFNI